MSDRTAVWKYGDVSPVITAPVDTATVISVGDLIYIDSGTNLPHPASDFTWDTNIATTQEEFHDVFLGVALQRSRAGDTDPIRVGTTGVYELDCAATTFELGNLLGPAKAAGNALLAQTVVATASAPVSIGRVARRYSVNTTKVLINIESAIMTGGSQVIA